MKKLLVLLLVLILTCTFLASCESLPPEIQDTINSIFNNNPGDDNSDVPPVDDSEEKPDETDKTPSHEHVYVIESSKEATCTTDGRNVVVCECGDRKLEPGQPALGHNYVPKSDDTPRCTKDITVEYECSGCGDKKTETIAAAGHDLTVEIELSRIRVCQRKNCSYAIMPKGDGKYKETIVYNFTDDTLTEFDSIYAELEAMIEEAEEYDATKHAYAEGTELHEAYKALEAKYDELYDIVMYVVTQYQIAQLDYHVNIKDTAKEEIFTYISGVRTDMVARFYEFSGPIYDSMYREFYYYGMTEQEIYAFILDSNAISNPEYKALVDDNTAIETEYNAIKDPDIDSKVRELYARFAANNKRIAEIMGYDNYVEYAYKNVYSRDYTYQDVDIVASYVKEHISSNFTKLYAAFNAISGYTEEDLDHYYAQVSESFFSNPESNSYLNDYIDLLAFDSNPDKQYTFSDSFNALVGDGNLFRGQYDGAYVTYLVDLELPIAYFGFENSNPFTVAHEFGHYMNEIYNDNEYDQSYDLLEMHSQGNEILYLHYLKDKMPTSMSYKLVEKQQILNVAYIIIVALAVDSFEKAVYTDTYTGADAAEIMADNTITANEYDKLFKSVLKDFGVEEYIDSSYWRLVVIGSPCYYASYSISAISVLQLYDVAYQKGFDTAKDSYLSLFTYTDVDPDMTTVEILEYAGLRSFNDEELYKLLGKLIARS